MSKAALILIAIVTAFVVGGRARATETVTYTYDALGRLVGVSTAGGPNDGVGVGTTYDPAGNRCTYTVDGAGAGGGECPGGGGTPPGNQPPTANPDSLTVEQCGSGSVNVTANDSDPEGLPLAVTQVAGGSKGIPVVVSGSTVGYSSTGGLGPDSVTYTVADSLGATSTGTVNVSITGEQQEICP